MNNKRLFSTLIAIFSLVMQMQADVTHLRTLGLDAPLGIESNPTFSWQLTFSARGVRQGAYAITVTDANGTTVWNSGRVESSRQTDVPYEGEALTSRTRYIWTVSAYDQNGSEIGQGESSFETGILSQTEWQDAQWIAPQASPYRAIVTVLPKDGVVPSRYVRFNVTASGPRAASDPGYDFVQIAEVEIYNTAGENVARTASFTATNAWELANYGWSISYINDGVISGGTNGFTTQQNMTSTVIVADLGSMQDVGRIVLYPRQDAPAVGDAAKAANFPSTYTVEMGETTGAYAVQYEVSGAPAPDYDASSANNVPYMGRTFAVEKAVTSARLYASALGVFTMWLNGQPVTANVLEPGESAFDRHVLYSTYDVTSLLRQGANTMLAQVAGGIANMSSMSDRFVKPELAGNSATTSLRAMLWITYSDGTSELIPTDTRWGSFRSPVTGSNWYGGEDYDARLEIDGLFSGAYDVSAWEKCRSVSPVFKAPSVSATEYPVGDMRGREYEPLRVVEEWPAVSFTRNSKGNYLVDFGQNFAGTYAFTLSAPAGTTITLYDSELQKDGACEFEYMYEPSGASRATLDRYTFSGKAGGETWGPQFMYHGFRYLEISGLPEAPDPAAFIAKRIRSNMETAGSFETSNTLLNSIHRLCYNGIQSQLYNTVTDCPHREKLGWLDVPNMMYQSLSYNFDVKALLSKVVTDAFDSQGASGYVPSTVPHFMRAYDDDLNWGGAAITIPWRNYKQYGDQTLMRRYYDEMKRLITYYGTLTEGHIIRNNYSVLSDWGQETSGLTNPTSSAFTLTCTYYYLLGAMAEMAAATGHEADAAAWTAEAAEVRSAFNTRFYSDGVYEFGNQANYGMALYYGLVDEADVPDAARRLAEAVKASDYSIRTGEIGLRPTLMALADNGYNDVVYKMARKTSFPSYGYWVEHGATTSLEYWDMSLSQNHCMMDHIEEWFFSRLGGISNVGEAYGRIAIRPWVPADLARADVRVLSPRGEVRLAWQRSKTSTEYSITVPAGAEAEVCLPIVEGLRLFEGDSEISALASVGSVSYDGTSVSFILGSGEYCFRMAGSTLSDEKTTDEVTDDYVLNPGFELRNTAAVPWAPTSWTLGFPDTGGSYGSLSTSDQRTVNPTEGQHDWHIWYNNNYISVRLSQTIHALPAGTYLLTGDMRCVDNAAVTGRQRLFATVGGNTRYSSAYNANGTINIDNRDNENLRNWQTLNVEFTVNETSDVIIGFDCPQGENASSLGGFQVDNVRLFDISKTSAFMAVHPLVQYATFCAPFEVTPPAEVTAYTCTGTEGNALVLNEVTTIPANTPVILFAGNGYGSTEFRGVREGSDDMVSYGLLTGNVSDAVKDIPYTGHEYLLQRQEGVTAFYKLEGEGYKVGVNRGYLQLLENAARPALYFNKNDDPMTVTALPSPGVPYTLSDGTYLINGRIVVVKGGVRYALSGQILK